MSLRPNIAGFDLATFHTLIHGPSAPERVQAVVDDVATRLAAVDAGHVRPVLDDVRRILTRQLLPGSVEKESSSLVNAVVALATTGQRPRWSDCDHWGTGFVGFAVRFPVAPSDLGRGTGSGPHMRTLVHWALLQRPIFGRPQGGWWSSYGYLSNGEVAQLLEYHERHPWLGEHSPRIAAEFFGRLHEIHAAGLDYWFHSS